jgi:hypothetical protein
MIAPVGHSSMQRVQVPHPSAAGPGVGSYGRGDDRAEHEPASGARQQEVGVLAVPAEAGAMGDGAVHDRVVIGERHGAVIGPPDAPAHVPQCVSEGRIVVDPRVSPDPSVWPQRSIGLRWVVLGQVRLGRHDHRSGAGHGSQRVGRSFRVPVGEAHLGMQAGLAPFEKRRPGLVEHLGARHADVGDPALGKKVAHFLDRGDRLRASHQAQGRQRTAVTGPRPAARCRVRTRRDSRTGPDRRAGQPVRRARSPVRWPIPVD